MKAHVGSGTVYLRGYENVETPDSGALLAKDNPDKVAFWATDESNYYGRVDEIRNNQPADDALRHHKLNPFKDGIVCDRYGSWERLPFADQELEEITSRQVFEHLSERESRQALEEARRVLKIDGILRLDVPDHDAALAEYASLKAAGREADAEFMLSHLLGSRKAPWARHMGSWTRNQLRAVVGCFDFEYDGEEENPHFYPAFTLRWRKVPHDPARHHPVHNPHEPTRRWRAAFDYCGDPIGQPLTVDPDWKVLEIGPGEQPWWRANHYCDIVERPAIPADKFTLIGDASALPFEDKAFDFVLMSHVMEHVVDPLAVAEELSRVAKSGVIVCPSPFKEGLFGFHEQDHLWYVWPPGKSGSLRLIPVDTDHRRKLLDPTLDGRNLGVEYSKVAHNLLRLPCLGLREYGDAGRAWFENAEPLLDVIFRWENECRVEILD